MPTSNHLTFLVPGSIEGRTGGYEYDRRMLSELRARGWTIDVRETGHDGALAGAADDALMMIDGLALGSIATMTRDAARVRLVPLLHMPGASGVDERDILSASRTIVVTGAAARESLVATGIDASRIAVVEPGTDRAEVSRGSGSPKHVNILSVGAVTVDKGHKRVWYWLLGAKDQRWSWTIVGRILDRDLVCEVTRSSEAARMADRVYFAGQLGATDVARAFHEADLFVLATQHETYGMAVAEAIACGLPVLATATGEIPKIVGEGGIVVPVADNRLFATELISVLKDRSLRDRLRQGALLARERLKTWRAAGDEMTALLEQVAGG